MKPIIVIVEDIPTEINKIKSLFSSNYDFYPENQESDNSFINNVRDSIDNTCAHKNQAEENVKNQLNAFSNKIAAFIVDYKLENVAVIKEVITGLKFYQDFISINYPTKPCMILTRLKNSNELNSIIEYIDKINDRNKLTLRLKQLDDSNFQNNVKEFVEQANPILQLIQKIEKKPIRNRVETLNQTLNDIKQNYALNYNDNIIQVLTDFANNINGMNDMVQNEFVNQCNNCKIVN